CMSEARLAATAHPAHLRFDATDPDANVLGYIDGEALYRLRFRRVGQQDLPGLPNGQDLNAKATPDGFLVTRTTSIFKPQPDGTFNVEQSQITKRYDDQNHELWSVTDFSPLDTSFELDEAGREMLVQGHVHQCSTKELTLSIWDAHTPRLE